MTNTRVRNQIRRSCFFLPFKSDHCESYKLSDGITRQFPEALQVLVDRCLKVRQHFKIVFCFRKSCHRCRFTGVDIQCNYGMPCDDCMFRFQSDYT